ncbi:DUF7521 family protein [Natrinema halophilum]|uniref:Uncharacterized protein n=1 Tax=Natrinema halophilum TaxID=1699371 RepID=A0A7D5KZ46_9EURY|nr:hypothetical protein [Natrinema halophilum]QLG48480.1 hypothetical protein HYG82_06280 [Natrinema halophilum]
MSLHGGLVIAKILTMGIGLMISLKGFQAYQRFGSEPMLFVAIGFAFISVGAVAEGILYGEFGLSISFAATLQTASVAIGLLFVLYPLYGRVGSGGNLESDEMGSDLSDLE